MAEHSVESIQAAFRTLGNSRRGFFERAVPLFYSKTILSTIGSLRGGRYNPPRAFDAFYLGDTATTAALETRMIVRDETGAHVAAPHPPNVLLSIEYDLQRVVDLNDPDALAQIGIAKDDLLIEWRLLTERGEIPLTHLIGIAALAEGIEALDVPSARNPDRGHNLVVIRSNLLCGSYIQIHDADGAFPTDAQTRVDGTKSL